MISAESDVTQPGDDAAACRLCGGELVEGGVSIPLLGPPRFSYKVRTTEVTVPLEAALCLGCGHVTLRAPDTEPIRQAASALDRASEWSGHPRRRPWGAGPSKGRADR